MNTSDSNNHIDHLTLNGKVFFYEDIKIKSLSQFDLISEFEHSTIQFCKDWLCGIRQFKINTSGSTGKPKTISINRTQMEISAEMTANAFGLLPKNSILVNLNTKYIAGMMMLVRGLHLGLLMDIIEPSSNPLRNRTTKHSFYAFVPLQLQTIIESEKSELLTNSKAIIVGGAPISFYQEELFRKLNIPIYCTYGMTETCTHVAIRKMGETTFKGLENIIFSIDNRNRLIIDSPTAIESPLRTNDVVKLISDTEFKWKGRFDNIINSGGIKIQIEELENKINTRLKSLNQNTRFIIASKPDKKLGSKIILLAENQFDVASIESVLEPFEVPKEYHFIDKFLETETGKIDRKKTLQFYL